jgi:hypothetical protein
LDKQGNPGFVSETTGESANLFYVTFPDQPNHPYASHLLNSQDLEANEIAENLIEESANKKRKREKEATAAAAAKEETPKARKRARR